MTALQFAVMHVPGVPFRARTVAVQRAVCGLMPVLEDTLRRGPWWNAQRAWQAILDEAPVGTTHGVLLQDDLYPCDTFVDNLTAALSAQPERAVVFFSTRGATNPDVLTYRWVATGNAINAGTALPLHWIEEFLEWAEFAMTPGYLHDDCVLASWVNWTNRNPVYNTVPSLVQHLGASNSSLGHTNRTRIASAFQQDLPLLDWSSEAIDAGTIRSSWVADVAKHLTPSGVKWLREQSLTRKGNP